MKPYYEQDGIVIFHGDCREVLPRIGKVDHVMMCGAGGKDCETSYYNAKGQELHPDTGKVWP